MSEQIPALDNWGDIREAINANTTEHDQAISEKMDHPTGTPTGSKFLRDDGSWATPPTGGDGTIVPGEDDTKAATAELADSLITTFVLDDDNIPSEIVREDSDATLGDITVSSVTSPFTDGESIVELGNNTSITVAAGKYGITVEDGVLKAVIDGVKYPITIGDADV